MQGIFNKAIRRGLFFCAALVPVVSNGQQTVTINLPDAQISAAKIVRGDGDTYGLGDWHCTFTLALRGATLFLNGKIVFAENANDFTTIKGTFQQKIHVGELERCRHCVLTLSDSLGSANGPNIGARGYRWFSGQGLIRRAKIQTDVFGTDAGHIGGTIQFVPIRVLVDCSIAKI